MKRQQLIIRCLVITLFVLLFSVSCTTVDYQRMTSQKVKYQETNKETLENIFDKLAINIATRFYNYKKNRVIKISLKRMSNNLPEELPLKGYIYKNLSAYFKDKAQFAFFPTNTLDLNCIIEIHLVKASTGSLPESNQNNPIELVVLIKDSNDEEIIYSLNKPLVDVVNSQEYLSFKKSFNPSSSESILSVKDDLPYLVVTIDNRGDSYTKIEDKTLYTSKRSGSGTYRGGSRYNGSGTYRGGSGTSFSSYKGNMSERGTVTYKSKREFSKRLEHGKSGWYPAKQRLFINGVECKLNQDIFYEGTIKPGKLELYTSFREGFYDSKTDSQEIGKRHIRRFEYDIKRGEDIKVEIVNTYTGDLETVDIQFNLYKTKEMTNGPFREKYYVKME